MRKFVEREEDVGYTTVGIIINHPLIRLLFDKRCLVAMEILIDHVIVKGTIL